MYLRGTRLFKRLIKILVLSILSLTLIVLGMALQAIASNSASVFQAMRDTFSWHTLSQINQRWRDGVLGNQRSSHTNEAVSPIQGDSANRLIRYPNKIEVPCPAQNSSTRVILIGGQSNSANHGGQRFISKYGAQVLNYYDGKCYIAQSPLLGSTGLEGESWTLLGNLMIETGRAQTVILAPTGVAGSEINQWRVGSHYHQLLERSTRSLLQRYRVTEMLWHQGETDYGKHTSQKMYFDLFKEIAQSIRSWGMDAPIYISQTSQCWMDAHWTPNNPVILAQQQLVNPSEKLYAGVNSDLMMNDLDRYDNCHFSGSGQEKFARAWLSLIK